MPLQGARKREYMRDYMRQRREMIAEEAAEPWCSFCGKAASEVRVLVRAHPLSCRSQLSFATCARHWLPACDRRAVEDR
jgi:hypothetical protein